MEKTFQAAADFRFLPSQQTPFRQPTERKAHRLLFRSQSVGQLLGTATNSVLLPWTSYTVRAHCHSAASLFVHAAPEKSVGCCSDRK